MQSSMQGREGVTGLQKMASRCWILIVLAGLVFGVGLVSAIGADAVPASSPDLHTFTNQDGRTIKAEISSVAVDDVYLKRDDGQSFKVSVSTLSKDDQNFIHQWVIKQAQLHGDDILTFGISFIKGTSDAPALATKTQVTTAWTEYYKIKVTNATPVHWANLQVRYIIFYSTGIAGALPPGNFTSNHAYGKVALNDLQGEQDQAVSTDKIDLKEVSLAPNVQYSNGAPAKVTDEFQGIWVRVYDENNNLLQEWAAPHDLIKNNNWDALSAPPRGGRRGAAPTRAN